jgi:hypothetical protein
MSNASPVEIIESDGVALAYIVDPDWQAERTAFLTPDDTSLQMGMIVYGAGQDIPAHVHLPITREVHGTNECVVVRKGRCRVTIYDSQRKFVAERDLEQGAIILLLGGGHGFHLYEDTILFEVKQGPYAGDKDKERF